MSLSILKTLSKTCFNTESFGAFLSPFSKKPPHTNTFDFFKAKIVSIFDNNKDIYTLTLKVDSKFTFISGQYIELLVEMNGRYIKRCFSISSSVDQLVQSRTINITIKKQVFGKVTPWLRDNLTVNSQVAISYAKGEFVLKNKMRNALLIASGSGITPFRSILLSHLNMDDFKQVTLMYFERDQNHIYLAELKQLTQTYPQFSLVIIDTKKKGRLSEKLLAEYCNDYHSRDIYLCGAANMIAENTKLLLNNSVPKSHIISEQFTSIQIADLNLKQDRMINFLKSNKVIPQLKEDQNNLLLVSQNNDIPANYGCGIGICHECKCKKHSGIVFNTKTQTYSDNGEEDIQLCISIPVTHVSLGL